MTTTGTKESSLMTAVLDREHQNRVQSRLCALPEEVIADIMYQMREADIYYIRHPPKVEFLVEQSTNGRLKREVELSWMVPLSAVDGESPGQHSYDQLHCPHVTWTKVRTQALKQYRKDFTCGSCHSEYSFSTKEGEKETFVQRRRLLWSNAQIENNYSRVLKVRLMDLDSCEVDTSLSRNVLWCDSEGCFNANANPNFRFDLWVKNQNPYAHLRIFESYSCQGPSTTHYPWSSDMFKEFKLCSCKGVNYVVDDLHEQLCKLRRERLRRQQELYDKYPWLFVDYLERSNDT
ncbi:hypothetical protein CGMCC3_g3775 [Colletotrichum fructicola]|uniref:Uncharacterized protein n=1 Tax=Colletotrichum fructicola (strain Nara gc5) TaxID=1213859 RepID=L2FA83_COLFN|nr:uncharacterized protein CGMCC3_g3775 [Colletotrichum fructicola]KAE9580069.1 hypothetical protein CGMCC3_g3775 [Colletotrichum fructicola]